MVPCKNIYKIYKLAAWEVQTDWKHQNMHSWDALKLVIKTVILMKIVFAVVWGLVVVHYHFGQELLGRNPQSWLLMFWSDTFVTTKNWGGNICHVLGPNAFICLLALELSWHVNLSGTLHMMHMNFFGLACAMQEPLQLQLELPVCANNTYNPKIAYWPVQSTAITVA